MPISVPLRRHQHGLWGIEVELAGERHPFLFDTGAGATVIDSRQADRIGRQADGRLTGHRMTGARVDIGQCGSVALGIGGRSIGHEVMGVFDLMGLLPRGFPPIGGVVALNSFAELPVTFDFRERILTLESDRSLEARKATMTPLEIRVGRPLQGLAVEVFVAARRGDATA